MKNEIVLIEAERLEAHPDNPNLMSRGSFLKLKRNIEKTGLYEPLTVRKAAGGGRYQILNGHHRYEALKELGEKKIDCVVWEVDDQQADVFLLSLNRLGGREILSKKMKILRRLIRENESKELGRVLPQTKRQIDGILSIRLPDKPLEVKKSIVKPEIFFLNEKQLRVVKKVVTEAMEGVEGTKANRRAIAMASICETFLKKS